MSVTNLGMFGTEEFTTIINPPHAAVLAVGAVREEPVVEDGVLAVGRVLRVTLSVDHRPVDGAVAARWMNAFSGLVEHPVRPSWPDSRVGARGPGASIPRGRARGSGVQKNQKCPRQDSNLRPAD